MLAQWHILGLSRANWSKWSFLWRYMWYRSTIHVLWRKYRMCTASKGRIQMGNCGLFDRKIHSRSDSEDWMWLVDSIKIIIQANFMILRFLSLFNHYHCEYFYVFNLIDDDGESQTTKDPESSDSTSATTKPTSAPPIVGKYYRKIDDHKCLHINLWTHN